MLVVAGCRRRRCCSTRAAPSPLRRRPPGCATAASRCHLAWLPGSAGCWWWLPSSVQHSQTVVHRFPGRHSACVDPACQLCKNNPHKTCTAQLRPKYVVGQEVAAPCGAPATVALAVRGSGTAAAARQWSALAAQGVRLQVLLVDERQRQQRAKDLLLAGASSASSGQVAKLLRDSVVAFDPAVSLVG